MAGKCLSTLSVPCIHVHEVVLTEILSQGTGMKTGGLLSCEVFRCSNLRKVL